MAFFEPAKSSPMDIIIWWEWRRLVYNLVMIVPGFLGLALVLGAVDLNSDSSAGMEEGFDPGLSAVLGAIGANICYTGGWMAEILARWLWKEKAMHFGPIAWSLGMIFSILFCFVPFALHLLIWTLSE